MNRKIQVRFGGGELEKYSLNAVTRWLPTLQTAVSPNPVSRQVD